MDNLEQLTTTLAHRLAEEGTVYWSAGERVHYLNESQRLIAKILGGIPVTYTLAETISDLPVGWLNQFESSGYIIHEVTGDELGSIRLLSAGEVDRSWPGWRRQTVRLDPLWVVLDAAERKLHVVPPLKPNTHVRLNVGVLPFDMISGSDELFQGHSQFEPYTSVVVTLAASLALLKERYEQDAERFYASAMREMQLLGATPYSIPTWEQVIARVDNPDAA